MNSKTQLLILLAGLVLIGVLFYLVNFTQPTPVQNKQETKQTQENKTKESSEKTAATPEHTAPQTKAPATPQPSDSDRYAPKSYKEVFKETPAPKSNIERITEQEVILKLDEQSDTLIKEANARVEAKNLKAKTEPLSPEKIEALQKQAESIQNKLNK